MNVSFKPYICDINNLSRPDGSAVFCHGDTSVQAAVYGPIEVKIQKEIVDKAHVEVVYKPKTGLPGYPEKLRENVIKNTCESAILTVLHPRTSITIILQELENRGSLLATTINAACLALMDSGIEMKYLLAAVCCALVNDEIITHPTIKQENEAEAVITFVFDSQLGDIVALNTYGIFSEEQFELCAEMCRTASQTTFDFFRESVKKSFTKEAEH